MKANKKHINTSAKLGSGNSAVATPIWERKYFLDFLIFAFSFLLYANSIPNEYNLDDELVTINHRLTSKGISAISEIFASPYYQDESGYSYEYRPVVLTSFAIEHDIFGDNPHWSHFWNVILYSLTCVILFRVLRILFQNYSPLIAIAITLLFVAHPAHTEVVCSIKNRDEIFGLMFSLLSLYFAVKSFRDKKWHLLIVVLLFFVLSLMSKITFLSFAILIPLAILFFVEFSFIPFLFVVTSLLIVVVTFADTSNIFIKIGIVLFGAGLTIIFFFIKHFHQVSTMVAKMFSWLFDRKKYSLDNVNDLPKSTTNDLFKDGFNIATLKKSFLFIFLNVLFIVSTLHSLYYLQCLVVAICVLLLFWKDEFVVLLSTCSIYVFILFRSYHFGYFDHKEFIDFLIIPITYNLIYGNRVLIVPSLIAIIVTIITSFYSPIYAMSFEALKPILFIVFMLLFRFKYGWIGLVAYALGDIFVFFTSGLGELSTDKFKFIFNQLVFFSTVALTLSIVFKRYHWILAKGILVMVVFLSIVQHPQQKERYEMVEKTVKIIGDINPKVISQVTNRPIDFAENSIDFVKTPQRVKAGTSLVILLHYLKTVAIPYPLSFYYGYSFITPLDVMDAIPLLALILYLIIITVGGFLFWKNRLICFGILFYLISLATFSNYFQPVPGMVADRFLLIPSIGWLIVLVAILFVAFKIDLKTPKLMPIPAGFFRYIFGFIFIAYSLLSFSRNRQWKDYLTLARHDIQYVSTSTQAHNLLGLRLMKSSYDSTNLATQLALRQEALGHFKRAVEIYPAFFNATFDIGRVYTILNLPDSALVYYERATKMNTTFADAFTAAGDIYFQKGQLDSARIRYEKLIEIFPTQYVGYDKVSYMYFLQKEYYKSIIVNKEAMVKIPSNPQAHISIAKAFYTLGIMDSVSYYLKKALEVDPGNQEAAGLLQNLSTRR
ncbi:MAG: glycosyltransferase family 39 protein [Chitinophagales bacterium]|nr:glycosyltransferase family 39 protein [Chitinophagales bacterium]